jgi:hypothetical protein
MQGVAIVGVVLTSVMRRRPRFARFEFGGDAFLRDGHFTSRASLTFASGPNGLSREHEFNDQGYDGGAEHD